MSLDDIRSHIRNLFDVEDVDFSILANIVSEVNELESRGVNVTGNIIDKVIELHSSEIMGKVLGNIRASMPGRSKLRRALPYLFKEAMERMGLDVELTGKHRGRVIDAAVKIGTTWIPVSLNYGRDRSVSTNTVSLGYDPKEPGSSDFIIDVFDRPPFYEMVLRPKVLGTLRNGDKLHGIKFDVRGEVIYNIWRFYRRRRYLVVPGPRVGMQLYDLEIVGFNRYIVKVSDYVPRLSAKRYTSYSKVIIVTRKGRPYRDGKLVVIPLARLIDLLDGDGILS